MNNITLGFNNLKPELPLEGNIEVVLTSIVTKATDQGGYTNIQMTDKATGRTVTETVFEGKPEQALIRKQSILNSIARQLGTDEFKFEPGLEFTISVHFNELYKKYDIKFYPELTKEVLEDLGIEVA